MTEMAGNWTPRRKARTLRLLEFIGAAGASVNEGAAVNPDMLSLTAGGAGGTRAFPADLVGALLSEGVVRRNGDSLTLRPEAASLLVRLRAANGQGPEGDAFAVQHRDLDQTSVEMEGVRQTVTVNRSESPLAPLLRLKGGDGKPFLPHEAVAAGERLAADFARAGLQPRVTASWEPRLQSRGRGQPGGMADLAVSAIEARRRVNRALDALGPDLAGIALDVCCFCKGLEAVERERQWPARSAKLMLRTALMALARHYQPPAATTRRDIRHWGADGYRPDIGER
ncbi:DUF6456 domain-containing protein [Rhizobium sp. PAMB 3182]